MGLNGQTLETRTLPGRPCQGRRQTRTTTERRSARKSARPIGGDMIINELHKLAALVTQERHALLARWRQQVRELPSARHLDIPTLNDHIPELLDELASALQSQSDQTIPEA